MNYRLKRLVLRLCNPLDYLLRRINGKRHLPPLHLRWDVGPLRGFESAASEFRVYLKLFAELKPWSKVLDIGCGCGQLALWLKDDLNGRGEYVGWDISRAAIDWCIRRIAAGDPRFSFLHLDLYNGRYNPGGKESAATVRLPSVQGPFDVVVLKSVFTHMKKEEVRNYLSQLPRLLSENGMCLTTFFLLREPVTDHRGEEKAAVRFSSVEGGVGYTVPDLPETTVAYDEGLVRQMVADAGLDIAEPVHYGSWAGSREALSHQDLILLRRRGGGHR